MWPHSRKCSVCRSLQSVTTLSPYTLLMTSCTFSLTCCFYTFLLVVVSGSRSSNSYPTKPKSTDSERTTKRKKITHTNTHRRKTRAHRTYTHSTSNSRYKNDGALPRPMQLSFLLFGSFSCLQWQKWIRACNFDPLKMEWPLSAHAHSFTHTRTSRTCRNEHARICFVVWWILSRLGGLISDSYSERNTSVDLIRKATRSNKHKHTQIERAKVVFSIFCCISFVANSLTSCVCNRFYSILILAVAKKNNEFNVQHTLHLCHQRANDEIYFVCFRIWTNPLSQCRCKLNSQIHKTIALCRQCSIASTVQWVHIWQVPVSLFCHVFFEQNATVEQ